MTKAGKKILRGLEEANAHAVCANQHVESHVTEKISEHTFRTDCMACGHSWTEEDRETWHKPIRVVRPAS